MQTRHYPVNRYQHNIKYTVSDEGLNLSTCGCLTDSMQIYTVNIHSNLLSHYNL